MVSQLDAVASGKHLELIEGDFVFVTEVPLDEIFKLAIFKLEATSLDERLKIVDVDDLSLLVLYPVEKSIEEHVVLLGVCELVVVLYFE